MKKTLVALAVTAFAASASAVTVYENEGSKIEFDGSVRLLLEKNSSKKDGKTTKRAHSNLHDDGSRLGVSFKHNIADDFYALGRIEFRFNGTEFAYNKTEDKVVEKKTTDGFGNLYTRFAYAGLGSKQFGEVRFGKQAALTDDVAQAGFHKKYGTFDTTLTTEGKSMVRYVYSGVEGLQVGVDYRFAENRTNNEVDVDAAKSGYGIAAIYSFNVAEGQSLKFAAGYTRDNFVSDTTEKHHKDAWALGVSYKLQALTLAADYAGAFDKYGEDKTRFNGFRLGAKYAVTPAVEVYTNYAHGVEKVKEGPVTTGKKSIDAFLLGSSYQLHKNVVTYVEGGLKKTTTGLQTKSKSTDKNIGVGFRVMF